MKYPYYKLWKYLFLMQPFIEGVGQQKKIVCKPLKFGLSLRWCLQSWVFISSLVSWQAKVLEMFPSSAICFPLLLPARGRGAAAIELPPCYQHGSCL